MRRRSVLKYFIIIFALYVALHWVVYLISENYYFLPEKVYVASHLLPWLEDQAVYNNKDEDLMVIDASLVLSADSLNEVYIPTLGNIKVLEYSDRYFVIDALGSVYNGISGTRVLTPDRRFDIGFVSRVENGKVIVVRTLAF